VPVESPVSVNITEYVTCVNAIDVPTSAPVTVTDPDEGEAMYPETEPTVYA